MKIIFQTKKDKKLKQVFDKEWSKMGTKHFGRPSGRWKPKKFVFKAVEADELIGYVEGSVLHGVGKVEELIVAKKYRGKGAGTALIKKAEKYIKKHGGWKVILTTGKDWGERRFYRKLGYKTIAYLKNHYLGCDFVMLEKRLQ
ncbi:MAG: GNAT family N-acetyltransferase [bacterium]|nr:GNAT family N-acetyltransferase [bacterium]